MRPIYYFFCGLSAWGCSGAGGPTKVTGRQTVSEVASPPIDLGVEQFTAEDTAVISTLRLDEFTDFSVVGLTYFTARVPDNQLPSNGAELSLTKGSDKQPSKGPPKPAAVSAERISHINSRHTIAGTELNIEKRLPGVFGETKRLQSMVLAAVKRRGAQATSQPFEVRFSDAIGVTFSETASGQIPMPTLTRFMRVIIAIDGEDSAPRVITAYPIVRSRTASRDTEIAAPSDLKVDEAFAKRVQTKLSNVTGRPAAPDPSQPERESRLKFSNEERLRRKAVLSEELKGQVQLEDMRHNISITLAAEREAKGVLRDRRRAEAAARLEEAAAAKRDAKRSKKAEAPVKAEPEPQSWWSSAFSRLFSW